MLAKTLMTVQNKSAMPTPAMAPPLVLSNRRLDKADNSLRNFLVALELGHQLFAEHLLDAEALATAKASAI